MLNEVTRSGYVKLEAMRIGTPISLMLIFGSGVITVRAECSTRLPWRLLRIRPSFEPRRC